MISSNTGFRTKIRNLAGWRSKRHFCPGKKLNLIFSERKGKLTKWRLTEDLKLEKVLDKDTGAILDMKFDQGMRFGLRTSIFIS